MAYNTKEIVKDVDGNPISQYYNPAIDSYEPVEGSNGGNKVLVENNQGLSLIPILDKLSQLTGTVIDEETRKSNELQRIVFFEMLQQMLEDGELKGEQGIQGFTGDGLEFTWRGTELGVRIEGEVEYIYVNLKGEKGDTGDIESLNSQDIEDALGYIPLSEDTLPSNLETTTGSQAKANVALTSANQYTDQKVGNVADNLLALEHSELSSIATDVDDEGIYRSVEYRRKDNTLYAKSTLIGSYPYSQIKIDYYNGTGNEIIKPISWNIGYDESDFPYIREVI